MKDSNIGDSNTHLLFLSSMKNRFLKQKKEAYEKTKTEVPMEEFLRCRNRILKRINSLPYEKLVEIEEFIRKES